MAQKMYTGDPDDVPGRGGCNLFYQQHCETFHNAMPDKARAGRQATIDRYDRRADTAFLGRLPPDFNNSVEVPDGDLKFTRKNAADLLSNTLGASKAEHHREVRAATLHLGTHPWEIKTTVFSFPRPQTTGGWDPDTKVDRSLQTLVHGTTLEKSFHNTRRSLHVTSYQTLQQQFSGHHDVERDAKRALRAELNKPHESANTGKLRIKARSRTLSADVAAVGALPDMDTPPKRLVNPHDEGEEGADDRGGTLRNMNSPRPAREASQQ